MLQSNRTWAALSRVLQCLPPMLAESQGRLSQPKGLALFPDPNSLLYKGPSPKCCPLQQSCSCSQFSSVKHLSLGPSPPWLRPSTLITCPSEPRPQGAQGRAGPLWLPTPGWPAIGHLPGSFFIPLRPSGCGLALALHKLRADSLDPSPLDLLEASSASLFFLFYAAATGTVTLGE